MRKKSWRGLFAKDVNGFILAPGGVIFSERKRDGVVQRLAKSKHVLVLGSSHCA